MTSNGTNGSATAYHASSTQEAIQAENDFAAHNYHPLPVVFARAQGTSVWDPEGRHYLDFLSAYSAVNQGHCHPKLVAALVDQASRLTLSSRAFYNDVFPKFAEMVTKYFGFDMVLPMNTGAEAVETGIKIARKWGYKVKGIPENEAIILSAENNFHGRTMAAISLSSDPESRENYGPYVPNIGCTIPGTEKPITYNDKAALREAFEKAGSNLAAFLVEPIQGEAGIIVPDDDYLQLARSLCDQHNVLLICDEIQTGIARTGKLLCHEWSGIKPDMVLLGKAISGGMYPVSCVLGRKDVMLTVEPGTHGSTYGGNPLACAVAIRALEVVQEENMVERAEKLGQAFRSGLEAIQNPIIQTVRGKGLLNAIVIDESKTNGHTAWDLCMLMKEKGLLAKPTHQNIIRLAPPLVITEEEIAKALEIIKAAVAELPNLKGAAEDKVVPPPEKKVKITLEN
ncbi:OAT_EMENI Ornithine aminotransferase (Ornithine--oxo-acid aminotransferase) [Aspergillus nidulans FGSC A4]|uniref:Ornithine aminotransferase n=1 Tax=Emericella nidulans (strain FGSC A4 / ATCC 38163 / CBS 112.46 / NRRL 194 / M139) TaxID=227321 RepID=OAT_EMENI|nr:ornithine-oxo-acid transaminase otaA [Aspergillus nidulans FGSC A4]Q92413.2 RecName: Full=Ornithine aminotransferase; AltName: Full=Ornithine--oxo-acid aminotransferase [Aspergillus nidulans FGSC A4]EAA64975.1 OAT_EMENI Ornithine aminotransferase (Ornithine--oxo-acid aminotransferase) [Aspergillus nidulans FGSC A4]CBF85604.1 TPA: Ornithine aminotransferase (EC 2.6.1.13)(Ornithine--oxo-acid aminotransferase) [Source:UniProtKB/Swiss-Prot;Acc:Q92413] [Aspergillus nidulans FGSC A4]|eukprot:XP_659414.1 OAT_EMENI Ornithine aminotransferase (Ornithine--oxo-acid aminotransferase) [Aspergillus nidulans FGSC A4]